MRSYEFPYPEAEQQTVVSRFGGIDCRTHPTKVSLSRSSTGYSPCRMVWAVPYMRVQSCIFGRRTARRPSCAQT